MKKNRSFVLRPITCLISKEYLILFIAMIIVFLTAYFNTKLTFYSPNSGINKMNIQIEKSEYSRVPYGLMWFDFRNETIKLNVNMLCDSSQIKIYALSKDEQVSEVEVSKPVISLKDTYSGSFATVMPSFEADLNNDGNKEKINLYAKADTIFTQGFVPVRTNFTDKQVPMEINNFGRGNIEISYGQKPLADKEVRLFSIRGLNKSVKTDENGILKVKDVRDLREGIIIVYVAEDNSHNIASYTVESSTLFTNYHYIALKPLIIVLAISGVLIAIIIALRKMYYCRNRKRILFGGSK